MARKRPIRSYLKGMRKKMKVSSSRRKLRTGRTRLRPEVKFMQRNESGFQIRNRINNSGKLDGNGFFGLINHPPQGTTDNNRIGDTIMGKKLYCRFTIYCNDAQLTKTTLIRVIFFNSKEALAPGVDIPGFFQVSWGRPTINGIVNREGINKVFYDKTFIARGQRTADDWIHKPININISMKWPIIYSGGNTVPKDLRNNVYCAVFGFSQSIADATTVGFIDCTTNFYFTDS